MNNSIEKIILNQIGPSKLAFRVLILMVALPLIGFLSIISVQAQDTSYAEKYQIEYQKRIRQTHLNGRYIPNDVQDAMVQLDQLVDEEGKSRFRSQPEENAVRMIHFTFGRWMIVNWGFYEGSRLSHFLRKKGISYPDDMASTLMYCYHRWLNEKPLQLDALADHFAEKREKEYRERLQEGRVLQILKERN